MAATGEPRILYFGMFGPLSRLPLAALLDAGLPVAAVIVPARAAMGDAASIAPLPPPPGLARPTSFAALLKQTVVDLAWERGIPAEEVARLDHGAVRAALTGYRPDLIAVSCFPYRFPPWLLALPAAGAINLHPSPLPRGRGPDPLFWLLREPAGAGGGAPGGPGAGGVTVHLMDRGLDAGPIVLQEHYPLADGMSGQEIELRAASAGAGLLVRAARAMLDGTARPRAQEEAEATTYPAPAAEDYVVTPDRPARWAFNFLRGTAGQGYPQRVRIGERSWWVRSARGYDPDATLPAPFAEATDTLRVRCSPGVLTVTTMPPRA